MQAKLKINEPGDTYEREADRIADEVLEAPAHAAVSETPSHIQRFSGQSRGPMETAPRSVEQTLASSGRPLEAAVQQDMEQRFGYDFSRVRVHTDPDAERSAQDVNAYAYTVGHNIVFGAGSYKPGTYQGRRLLAHELTHVVQQGGGSSAGQVQRDAKKEDKPAETKKDNKPVPQDIAVLLSPDASFVTVATVIAPGATVLHATSVADLSKQLKAIKGPVRTLYFVAHMNEDGDLLFTSPGKMTYVPAEQLAADIKGTVQVENVDFRGCNLAQAPAEMDKIRVTLNATKATGSTCTLVTQISDPVKVDGKPITRPEDLTDNKTKIAFEAGLKKTKELFVDAKKKCIINDSKDGYFQTGGKLLAVWANPESMADDTGWDDSKSICYSALRLEKVDLTKKPVIDPNDCKLVEVGKTKK